jgi:hypothetical protein
VVAVATGQGVACPAVPLSPPPLAPVCRFSSLRSLLTTVVVLVGTAKWDKARGRGVSHQGRATGEKEPGLVDRPFLFLHSLFVSDLAKIIRENAPPDGALHADQPMFSAFG